MTKATKRAATNKGSGGSKAAGCKATASGGALTCVLEQGHDGAHSTSPRGSRPVQHVTWISDASGKVAVTSFARGKKQSEWTEEGVPCTASRNNVWHAPAQCSLLAGHAGDHGAIVDVSEGWPEYGERRLIAWDVHGNGTRNEVISPAPGRSAPMTLEDEPEDPNADQAAIDAMDAGDDPLEDELRSDDERDFARKMREDREAHAAEIAASSAATSSPTTYATITCAGREWPVHPAALLFPTPEPQYREIVDSIRTLGQLHEVELLDVPGNPVIDGCSRLRACGELGIAPCTKIVHADNPIRHVIAVNLARRHLDESQRAMAAADLATLEHGANQHTRTGKSAAPATTQAEAAELLHVSERSVRDAARVKNQGIPEVVEAVRAGRIKVSAGAKLVELGPAEQRELVEQVTKGKGEVRPGKVRALVKQRQKREVVQRINRDLVAPMPVGPFGLIVVDYPWPYENSDQHAGSRGHLPYPPMAMAAIHAHAAEASKRAADDCVLGLWVTNAHLLEVKGVLDAWGVTYQVPITWDKVHVGMGISGPRGQTEHLVIAYRGKPPHTLNELTTLIRTPREPGHSKKPDLFYELLAKHCAGPRLELFAIGPREGWTTWGAEAEKPIATARKSKIYTQTDALVGTVPA